jgi:membrane-bound metal-dependent hydrolase YbcI (DUF457 family)
VGLTHSYAFGLLLGLGLLALTRSRVVAISFVIGQWLHVTSDMLDSVGVMGLFPFSTMHLTTGAYAYAGELGRLPDAHAYYTGLGGMCDLVFAAILLLNWRVLTTSYFEREVAPSDPAFIWLRARIGAFGCRTLYLTSAFFGLTSILGWLVWALVWQRWNLDWSMGGPSWVPHVSVP